ncbi:MAG: hypothetical protein CFE34_09710 [Rhodobacteraceae bacterium PARR1]|nr:MAG: hypothetical protein CFE34_09710 [Rhodobacteraceae bacterium PARR1]
MASRLFGLWLVLPLILLGCVTTPAPQAPPKPKPAIPVNQPKGKLDACLSPKDGRCQFRQLPLDVAADFVSFPGQEYRYQRMVRELGFVDSNGQDWIAPPGTWTDGATIPGIATPFVGGPRNPRYIAAAAVHDAYCGVVNADGPVYHSRPWPEVHRMFYEGLLVGGTPVARAQLMYAAVWLGGPRWTVKPNRQFTTQRIVPADAPVFAPAVLAAPPAISVEPPLLEGAALEAALAEVKAEIAAEQPQIGELDAILLDLPAVQEADAAAP